jgi:hypothetical protein
MDSAYGKRRKLSALNPAEFGTFFAGKPLTPNYCFSYAPYVVYVVTGGGSSGPLASANRSNSSIVIKRRRPILTDATSPRFNRTAIMRGLNDNRRAASLIDTDRGLSVILAG